MKALRAALREHEAMLDAVVEDCLRHPFNVQQRPKDIE
jgi:hypothetical protein